MNMWPMRLRQFPATFLNFRNTCFKVSIIVRVKLKVIYSSFIVLFIWLFTKSIDFSSALTFTNNFTFVFTFQKIIMLFFAFCLKIKCNVFFLFVEVNFSTSVFNINKSIWVLKKITNITNLWKKVLKSALDDLFTFCKWWRHGGKTNDDNDQLT